MCRLYTESCVDAFQLKQIMALSDEKLKRLSAIIKATQLKRSEECQQVCKLLDAISELGPRMRYWFFVAFLVVVF